MRLNRLSRKRQVKLTIKQSGLREHRHHEEAAKVRRQVAKQRKQAERLQQLESDD